MRSLHGVCVWCCLLRRGALSVLDSLFDGSNVEGRKPSELYPLSRGQLRDLETVLDITPMLYTDLSLPTSTRIYASDALKVGGGVVYSDLHAEDLRRGLRVLDNNRISAGWHTSLFLSETSPNLSKVGDSRKPCKSERVPSHFASFFEEREFKIAISTAWQVRTAHITLLEMEAVKLTQRHMSKTASTREQRVLLYVDNTGELGAVGKGRSSCWALNRLCRQFLSFPLRLAASWTCT